jgi:hypothetical protein
MLAQVVDVRLLRHEAQTFLLAARAVPDFQQMPSHDGLGHASLFGILGNRLAFLRNDGEEEVKVRISAFPT